MKKRVASVIIFACIILLTVIVQAKSGLNAILESNTYQLKDTKELVVTLKYDEYIEIDNGINAYKATLEYDENIFEQVSKEDFKLLNSWSGLEYNKDTKEFVAIKKEGSKTSEEVAQITLKVKENLSATETTIKIKEIVASEGIEDIYVNDIEVKIDILSTDVPPTPPEDTDKNENQNNTDNSNTSNNTEDNIANNNTVTNSTTNNTTTNTNTSNNVVSNNNQTQNKVSQTTTGQTQSENLANTPLPKAGNTGSKLFIIVLIIILIVNIVFVRKKQKNIDKEIKKKLKIFTSFCIIGIIFIQCLSGVSAIASSNVKGELNGDERINDIDINLLELHLVHLQTLPENKLPNADINSDNKITVTDLSLLLQMEAKNLEYEASKTEYRQTTSMYSWQEQTLVENATAIYQALHDLDVDTLYQDINSSYMTKEYIEGIIEDYNKQGIKVYRLIGDPSWAYNSEKAKKYINEIGEYNKSVGENARLKGVNLDIEPYVDSRWDENPQEAFTQYKNTMIELYEYAKQYNLEVVICTNTWFSSYEGYEELYEKAADTFSIMNYVKSSNIKGIKEEVEIAEKYKKKLETIAHSSDGSNETESYHNDGIDKLKQDHEAILDTYSNSMLRPSYHYFTTIEHLIDEDVYLLLKADIVDNSGALQDLVLVASDGKEFEGYPIRLGYKNAYIFPGVKENLDYKIKSNSHVAVDSDTITIPESPKGRATLTVQLKEKSIAEQNTYTVMSDINYTETLEEINNPERGFYYPVGMDMKLEGNKAKNPNNNLVHLRVGIGVLSKVVNGESDLPFTQDMLNTLNETLANIKKNGGSAIIRFAYDDFDGKKNLEPSLDMILTHINQLSTVFNANKDVIAYIELGFFGPWGEMHSSDICTTENVSKAIDEMLKSAPYSMKIGVRTPKYYSAWANIDRSKLNTNITLEGTDSYRIGLYNDGYLGSESDLGTFDNREIEIAWLENQAVHTLYGGEVVANYAQGTPLNTIEYISQEAFRTHTTYLNSEWNDDVIASWKKAVYNGSDELYQGQSGYLYVSNHLGYRFMLKKSQLTDRISRDMNLKLKLDIENVGFGNLVNEKQATIVLEQVGKKYEIATNIDATKWNSTEISNVNFEVKLPEDITTGEWNVYLRISQEGNLISDNNYNCIQFANLDIWNEDIGANYIGKIQVVE